jgi:hypothetical protein
MNYRAGSMREKQMNTQNISPTGKVDKASQRNDEPRMTNEEWRAKFVIRHSSFIIFFALIAFCGLSVGALGASEAADPRKWVAENLGSLVQLYRHLHQTPELS